MRNGLGPAPSIKAVEDPLAFKLFYSRYYYMQSGTGWRRWPRVRHSLYHAVCTAHCGSGFGCAKSCLCRPCAVSRTYLMDNGYAESQWLVSTAYFSLTCTDHNIVRRLDSVRNKRPHARWRVLDVQTCLKHFPYPESICPSPAQHIKFSSHLFCIFLNVQD